MFRHRLFYALAMVVELAIFLAIFFWIIPSKEENWVGAIIGMTALIGFGYFVDLLNRRWFRRG